MYLWDWYIIKKCWRWFKNYMWWYYDGTNTVTTNSNDKKVRQKASCYILYAVLSVFPSLFIIITLCFSCIKHWLINDIEILV